MHSTRPGRLKHQATITFTLQSASMPRAICLLYSHVMSLNFLSKVLFTCSLMALSHFNLLACQEPFAFFTAMSCPQTFFPKSFSHVPSWHLFPIGPKQMCSFGWILPPVLPFAFKTRDSQMPAMQERLNMTRRGFTLIAAPPQEANRNPFIATATLHCNLGAIVQNVSMSLPLFIRH